MMQVIAKLMGKSKRTPVVEPVRLSRKTHEVRPVTIDPVEEAAAAEEARQRRSYYEHLYRRQRLIEAENRSFNQW